MLSYPNNMNKMGSLQMYLIVDGRRIVISVVFVTDKELCLFKNKSHVTVFCIQHFHHSWSMALFYISSFQVK